MKNIYKIKSRLKRNGGFTLLETMVAMIILAVGILGIAPLLVTSMQGNQYSREVTTAAYLAQERIEQLKNQGTISPLPFNESVNSSGYTRVVNVSDSNQDGSIPAGLYRITVTINWTDKQGRSRSTSYITYKAK